LFGIVENTLRFAGVISDNGFSDDVSKSSSVVPVRDESETVFETVPDWWILSEVLDDLFISLAEAEIDAIVWFRDVCPLFVSHESPSFVEDCVGDSLVSFLKPRVIVDFNLEFDVPRVADKSGNSIGKVESELSESLVESIPLDSAKFLKTSSSKLKL
jgi:hypothetical protein